MIVITYFDNSNLIFEASPCGETSKMKFSPHPPRGIWQKELIYAFPLWRVWQKSRNSIHSLWGMPLKFKETTHPHRGMTRKFINERFPPLGVWVELYFMVLFICCIPVFIFIFAVCLMGGGYNAFQVAFVQPCFYCLAMLQLVCAVYHLAIGNG